MCIRDRVAVKGDGFCHEVSGSVFENGEVHIVKIDEYLLDIRPSGHLILVPHRDQPKVVGMCGMILGENNINIAGMQLGRREAGGVSLMALDVDSEVPAAVLKEIEKIPAVEKAAYLNFGE